MTFALCRAEAAPLGQRGGAVYFVVGSAVEAALGVEVVADGGVDGGEHLQTSHAPEPLDRPFSSSERQVRVLRPIVQPAARLLAVARAELLEGCAIGAAPIGDEHLG